MVDIIKTKYVTHKHNDDYECVLIQFNEEDKHFFKNELNWLPKHQEIYNYLKAIMETEPQDKKQYLFDYFLKALAEGLNYKK